MTAPDLSAYTQDWRLEEQGKQDAVVRDLLEAVAALNRADRRLRDEESQSATRKQVIQAECAAHNAVEERLSELADALGIEEQPDADTEVYVE